MNKSDIVGEVAARTGLSRTDAAGAVDAVFKAINEALGRREEVRIAGSGRLATHDQPGPCRTQSAHGRAHGGGGVDRADIQAGTGAPGGREHRRHLVSRAGPAAREFVECRT